MTVNVGFFFFLSFFEYWRSSLFGIWFIVVQRFCSMNHRPNFNSLRTTITWELPTRNRKKGRLRGHLIYFLSTVLSVFICPIALRYRIHQPFSPFKFEIYISQNDYHSFALHFLPHNILMPYLCLFVRACRGNGIECGFCLHEEVTECCRLAFRSRKR